MNLELNTPVQFIKGVGPKISLLLARKDIHEVADLLRWFPRAYEDRRNVASIRDLQLGQIGSFEGTVLVYRKIPMGRTQRFIHEIVFQDDQGAKLAAKWFRVPFRTYFDGFPQGARVRVTGEVKIYRSMKEIHHPELTLASFDDSIDENTQYLLPIYSETEGLNQKLIRKIINGSLGQAGHLVEETLPEWILRKYSLPPLHEALQKVHNPGNNENVDDWIAFKTPYHRRLIFEEFFWLELMLARSRSGVVREKAPAMQALLTLGKKIRALLPFQLTEGQEKALAEITADLIQPHPMNRLVQGDVGCGKTLVALISAALVIENGYQAALMVPTEILAEQHFQNARRIFEKLDVKVGFLTGSQTGKEQKQVKEALKNGEIQLVVGTHALIQEDVEFHRLALVVVDEQHRFGVKQRAELKKKGFSPHFLVMTATPIPRSLAMTAYGDLDVSVIRQMPKGRQPILTRLTYESKRDLVYTFIREQLSRGRQAYAVYPLVEESEKIDLKNATEMAQHLQEELKPFKVGLLHGRQKAEEKEALMEQFKKNEIQALVSTTVIEVGVDVSNATIMLVEHAERFGLAQLHQLRGRVGRGEHKSYCILMAGRAVSTEAKQRLEVLVSSQDGFKIAEEDLAIRGPGEFLGTRQSGLPGFKLANLVRDVEILIEARDAAFEIIRNDPELKSPDNKKIREAVIEKKASHLLLASVG